MQLFRILCVGLKFRENLEGAFRSEVCSGRYYTKFSETSTMEAKRQKPLFHNLTNYSTKFIVKFVTISPHNIEPLNETRRCPLEGNS
jgi:hypothetical protein